MPPVAAEVDLKSVSKGEELPFLQAGAGVLGPAVLVLRRDADRCDRKARCKNQADL